MVEFSFQKNAGLVIAFNKYILKKAVPIFVFASVMMILLGVAVFFLSDNIFGMIGLVILGLVFTPAILLLSAANVKKASTTSIVFNRGLLEYHRLDEACLHIELRDPQRPQLISIENFPYEFLTRCVETKDYFFAYIASNQAYIIPKAALIGGTLEDARQIFATHLGTKFVAELKR